MIWSPQRNKDHRLEALNVNRKWDLPGQNVSVGGNVHSGCLEMDYCKKKSLIPLSEQVLRAENCQWQRHSVWLKSILIGVKKSSWVIFHIRKNDMGRLSPRQLRNSCCLGELQAVNEQSKGMIEIGDSERRISKRSRVTSGSALEQSVINLFTECFATQRRCALRTVTEGAFFRSMLNMV